MCYTKNHSYTETLNTLVKKEVKKMNEMSQKFCQCCGMPMGDTDELYGTNADGSKNEEYCKYCYGNAGKTNFYLLMITHSNLENKASAIIFAGR